jgi:hypothetical protein
MYGVYTWFGLMTTSQQTVLSGYISILDFFITRTQYRVYIHTMVNL